MKSSQDKYLTFMLENELYGISILKVKEIIGVLPITHIPKMPSFVKGIINLRGKVIPVIDLRLRFGFDSVEQNDRTCIIVIEMDTENGKQLTGAIVDQVWEVMDVLGENIEQVPTYGENNNQEFISGIGKVKGKVLMLIDTDKVLSSHEIHMINNMHEHQV